MLRLLVGNDDAFTNSPQLAFAGVNAPSSEPSHTWHDDTTERATVLSEHIGGLKNSALSSSLSYSSSR